MENDWQKYREYFPVRYFELGYFDNFILNFLKNKIPKTILDIGGGLFGTEVLKNSNAEVYLLDPFIPNPPDWMAGKVDFDHNQKFDLIVCRGAINYLTLYQISQINKWIKKDGVFMANSFIALPKTEWTSRDVKNSQGVNGVEKYRLNGNVIDHELVFPDYEIKHSFFAHTLEDYKQALTNLTYQKHGSNSVIIQVFG